MGYTCMMTQMNNQSSQESSTASCDEGGGDGERLGRCLKPGFFKALDQVEFDGYLAIEREAGDQRVADIEAAVNFVTGL